MAKIKKNCKVDSGENLHLDLQSERVHNLP